MGNDMVVALPKATADHVTLFGHNCNRPLGEPRALERVAGKTFTAGERLRTPYLSLPQVKNTLTVLAARFAGSWGYAHGVNERGVSAGVSSVKTRLVNDVPGLTGPDLVRLALERSPTALQAVDVVTDLIGRHGPGVSGDDRDEGDPVLLVADGREAYLLSACSTFWAVQEVREVRAQSDVCQLRQDWDRISPGLAQLAISRGWWPDDGSKLDFAGALVGEDGLAGEGLRRWGRATVVLEQHNGQLDTTMVRRLMADLGEAARGGAEASEPAASLVVRLTGEAERPTLAWWCCGIPGESVYLPVTIDGELPEALMAEGNGGCGVWRQAWRLEELAARDARTRAATRSVFPGLQARFDRDAADYLAEAAGYQARGDMPAVRRLATAFMQHAAERFEETCDGLCGGDTEVLHLAESPIGSPLPL
jgi:secernin